MPRINEKALSVYRWLADRPSYMLLTASPDRLASAAPRRFAAAWLGLVLQAIAWGFALNVVWDWAGQNLSGPYYGLDLVQVTAVAAVWALWPYRRSIASLAESIAGGDPASRAVVGAVLVVCLVMALLAGNSQYRFDSLYPGNGCARTILVMPLWGAWAMLITCQFCRRRQHAEPAVEAFARGCGPIPATLVMGVPWVLTWVYFNYLGWKYLVIPGCAVATALAGGLLLCRLGGGLSRRTLLATNTLVQLAVLVAYLYVGRNH